LPRGGETSGIGRTARIIVMASRVALDWRSAWCCCLRRVRRPERDWAVPEAIASQNHAAFDSAVDRAAVFLEHVFGVAAAWLIAKYRLSDAIFSHARSALLVSPVFRA